MPRKPTFRLVKLIFLPCNVGKTAFYQRTSNMKLSNRTRVTDFVTMREDLISWPPITDTNTGKENKRNVYET